jgi:hypothetical protein
MRPLREIRRDRFAELVKEAGGQSAAASRLEKDKNQVYQWLLDPDNPASRNISDRTARSIERAFERPHGWLDHEPPPEQTPLNVDLGLLGEVTAVVQQLALRADSGFSASDPELLEAAYAEVRELNRPVTSGNVSAIADRVVARMRTSRPPKAEASASAVRNEADRSLKPSSSAYTASLPDPVMLAAAFQWTLIGIALHGGPTLKLSTEADAQWLIEVYSIVVRGGGAPPGRESSPELEAVIRRRAQEVGSPHERVASPRRGEDRRRG